MIKHFFLITAYIFFSMISVFLKVLFSYQPLKTKGWNEPKSNWNLTEKRKKLDKFNQVND